jgi:hypothetical protein
MIVAKPYLIRSHPKSLHFIIALEVVGLAIAICKLESCMVKRIMIPMNCHSPIVVNLVFVLLRFWRKASSPEGPTVTLAGFQRTPCWSSIGFDWQAASILSMWMTWAVGTIKSQRPGSATRAVENLRSPCPCHSVQKLSFEFQEKHNREP